jgi:hypothetical protein
MNEGWMCPRCKKVNAPGVEKCDCKEDTNDFESLKKHLKEYGYIPQKPIIPYIYYPDWTYRPFWPFYPDWIYRPYYYTSTGDICIE